MFISLFGCCVLSGRGPCDGLRPTKCGVSECDREASIMGRPWPTRVFAQWRKKWKISQTRIRSPTWRGWSCVRILPTFVATKTSILTKHLQEIWLSILTN